MDEPTPPGIRARDCPHAPCAHGVSIEKPPQARNEVLRDRMRQKTRVRPLSLTPSPASAGRALLKPGRPCTPARPAACAATQRLMRRVAGRSNRAQRPPIKFSDLLGAFVDELRRAANRC